MYEIRSVDGCKVSFDISCGVIAVALVKEGGWLSKGECTIKVKTTKDYVVVYKVNATMAEHYYNYLKSIIGENNGR